MAKSNGKNNTPQGKAERIFSLADSTLKEFKSLVDSADKISKGIDNRKKTNSEIAAKEAQAKTEYEKEKNRANEAMANIELEVEKARDSFAKGELQLSMVQGMVQMIVAEYDKLNNMSNDLFLGEEAMTCRNNIRNNILEMTKELLP